MAYEFATKVVSLPSDSFSMAGHETESPQGWWNKNVDQGPIVENGTHICEFPYDLHDRNVYYH